MGNVNEEAWSKEVGMPLDSATGFEIVSLEKWNDKILTRHPLPCSLLGLVMEIRGWETVTEGAALTGALHGL